MASLYNIMASPDIEKLFADIDASNEGRIDFTNAFDREHGLKIVHAVLWLYGCRSSDFAAAYASHSLAEAIGKPLAERIVALLEFHEFHAPVIAKEPRP